MSAKPVDAALLAIPALLGVMGASVVCLAVSLAIAAAALPEDGVGSLSVEAIPRVKLGDTDAPTHGPPVDVDPVTVDDLRRELGEIGAKIEGGEAAADGLRKRRAVLLAEVDDLENAVAARDEPPADDGPSIKELRNEIAALTAEIDRLQRQLDAADRVSARSLVPAGTTRRALFVECDGAGAWVRPAGTKFAVTPSAGDRKRFVARATSTGYVVFLIRPDGYTTFERYRDVIETHNKAASTPVDFGFEPVDADWDLAFPED